MMVAMLWESLITSGESKKIAAKNRQRAVSEAIGWHVGEGGRPLCATGPWSREIGLDALVAKDAWRLVR